MSTTARFWLLATLIIGVLVYLLAPVLTPFVTGALLAYLGDPLVDRLERWRIGRWRIGRTGGVLVVFTLMTLAVVALVLLLIPMLERQVARLINELPAIVAWFEETALPWLSERLGADMPSLDGESLSKMLREHWQSAGGLAAGILAGVSKSGLAIVAWLINLVLVPVVTFYLLRDWDVLVERVRALLPRPVEPSVSRIARESDQVLGAFLRGQLTVMLALAAIFSIGLSIVGLNLALLIGIIAGLISFVPYLGTIIGLGLAVIATLVQHGDVWHLVGVLAVFGIGNALEGMVLQPLLIGDRIGLHPVAVIFAVMAGGQLFGFLGILLALPVAAVLMVVLRHLHELYRGSAVYGADTPAGVVVLPEGAEAAIETPPPATTDADAS